jgi:hypothetical protein
MRRELSIRNGSSKNGALAQMQNLVTRILEKQNRLQMSQVFPFRASMIKWASLSKDSKRGRFTQPMLLPRGVANP